LGDDEYESALDDFGSDPGSCYMFDFPDTKDNIEFAGEDLEHQYDLHSSGHKYNSSSGAGRYLKCATLNKLIQRVTHPHIPPHNIRTVFLLMYHSFTTARDLLARLVSRYFMPLPVNVMPDELAHLQKTQRNVRLRVKTLVVTWIKEHYNDFTDDIILKHAMKDFLELIGLHSKVRILEDGPRAHMQDETKYQNSLLPPHIDAETWNFSAVGSREQDVETARQLTLMAFEQFEKMRMRDVLAKIFEGKENEHISSLVRFFNNMNHLVQVSIVSEPKMKERALLFQKFVDIAWELKDMNNFHISFAVSSALGSDSVYRLKRTKELLPTRTVEKISTLNALYAKACTSDKYRVCLRKAVQNPCVPYIGTTLKDLTFAHDGNADFLRGMVNFHKRMLMSTSIQQLDQFQKKKYTFEAVAFIQDQLNADLTKMEEDGGWNDKLLYEKSLQIEPREPPPS